MEDPVALVSVVSSGLVALGGLWVTYRGAREQRRHEAQLAYEGRAWEKKSDGLFEVISVARQLVDTLGSPSDDVRNRIVFSLWEVQGDLAAQVGVVEAYASDECRAAFDRLRSLILEARPDFLIQDKVTSWRKQKEEAIDALDFERAALARREEREAMQAAANRLGIDLDNLRERAEALIDAARASVRGDL